MITSDGMRLFGHTNRNNNIYLPDLEKMIVKDVACIRVPNFSEVVILSSQPGMDTSTVLNWAGEIATTR